MTTSKVMRAAMMASIRDGRRRALNRGSGHSPIARAWLGGGEFTDAAKIRPPRGPSAIAPAAPPLDGRRRD